MAIERPAFVPPSWHQGETAEEIQGRMMDSLPPDIDNIEGGFPYDFTMPTALEADELLNFTLIETLKVMFPAWAYGEYLDYHAEANGLVRRPAVPAVGIVTINGVPGTEIQAGTILAVPAVGDTPAIEFKTTETSYISAPLAEAEEFGTTDVHVTAVIPGTGSNVPAHTITILASPIKGVKAIANAEPTTGGAATEDDDALYERIVQVEQTGGESFTGCDADYIRWAKEVAGVGTVLVDTQYEEEHPNWVKLIVLDSNGQPANSHIRDEVYDHIMCPGSRSLERKAPIGAVLVVEAPYGCTLDYVVTGLQINDGSSDEDIIRRFKSKLDTYYVEAKEAGVISWNRVHAIFTQTAGVGDFTGLTINGGTKNIKLETADYPVTQSVEV